MEYAPLGGGQIKVVWLALPIFLAWLALIVLVLFWDVIRPPSNTPWLRSEIISLASLIFNVVTFAGAATGVVVAFNAFKLTDDRTKIEQRGQVIDIVHSWTVDRLDDVNGPVVSFTLLNPGRTAAYILDGTYESFIGNDLPRKFVDNPRHLPRLPGILRQGQKSPIVISEHLPPLAVNVIRQDKSYFYLRIIIWYRDIFGTRYELRATAKYGKIDDKAGRA